MSTSPTESKKDGIKLQNLNDAEIPLQPDSEYDPHLHRNVPHPTTNTETLVHLLKGSLGTGILAMPKAFHQSGYLNGIVCTILIGILCTWGLHILVRSQYILCKRHRVPILTYPVSMKMALEEGPPYLRWLAPFAILIVDGFLIVYQLGICCVYIVFVAKNIKEFVDVWYELDVEYYMLILLLPLILLNCIRNLKVLAPFSTLANAITFIGIGLILYFVFQGLQSIGKLDTFGKVNEFPLFFGTTLFAIEAVGVVVALENNMQTPKSFGSKFGVLNVGMFVITLLYAFFGFVGYWKYGEHSKDSITLNLPPDSVITKIVQGIFTVATFISYGLQCYVPVEIIWGNYLKKRFNESLIWELVVRIVIVLITFLLAISVPQLALFISLFGALCLSVLGIAFPSLMEICVLYPNNWGRCGHVVIRNVILIAIGLFALITGTNKSLVDIIATFSNSTIAPSNSTIFIPTTSTVPNGI
ncbi:proton-coupled amino acid transporter-like protein CG1139 [Contarinia nasturtii]|uniref:proton-coupled amino acid transporter-like protein CG1139 n=1 Tax=Contarinia nasturtii TaxID=265458 RepID=UPI0012D3AEAF|nr:proton-coupled amino acid transporter-like protein CG1139 [Contarinia nasturtii]XP_031641120.1 proton-coupled amino acid transporter-like protein CG1139 [Contarinia nasturtii]XP_031641121.1 proton-coupled amino acid transporter-like protein CG1139 [Contarinia nasturtii]XP_031641122.1 proton-coupled amino acid transporter-like protein CG1139 [Contarinia nasturtii]XP_031641124.1 proton-coupled amino acid transporter-like protein CG1139 [Contarinia nasturtii]XP_031641125.1 proton-coupled amino